MSDPMEDLILRGISEPHRGPVRMEVLTNPTAAQVRAVPIGSDVAFTDMEQFMSGPWNQGTLDHFAGLADREDCGHLHGFMLYVPPATTEDSALSAEDIAIMMVDRYQIALASAQAGTGPFDERGALLAMVSAAVHTARDGMLYPPF